MPRIRVGSLCTGYGGIELAVEEVFGDVDLIWMAEKEEAASKVLACRFPSVPNLGDITKVDFKNAGEIDLLTAGFPCQDVSAAGMRKGLGKGTRTGLWYEVARAVYELHPPLVFLENVHGLLSGKADSSVEYCAGCMGDGDERPVLRALGAVQGDLAEMGYDSRWCCVPASAAGAPHRRERVFVLAFPDPDCAAQ